MSSDSVLIAAAGQVSCELGEEVVILDVEGGTYFGLQGVGARVWEPLDRPVAVSEIERVVLEEYDVEPERCRWDLVAFLSGLVTRGLVEVQA
ncbi:MAG: PqqD family protein [Gemmatimonadota bacterium]